jgi:hypothetical protein
MVMAGLPLVKTLQKFANGFSNIISGGDPNEATPNEAGNYDNPGMVEANTTSFGTTGKTFNDGRFAQFENKVLGLNAIPYTFTTGMYDGAREGNILNIEKAIKIYKPPEDNPIDKETGEDPVQNHIDDLINDIGKDTIDLSNKDEVEKLIFSVTKFEGSDTEYYDSNSIEKAAELFLSPIKPKPKRK